MFTFPTAPFERSLLRIHDSRQMGQQLQCAQDWSVAVAAGAHLVLEVWMSNGAASVVMHPAYEGTYEVSM